MVIRPTSFRHSSISSKDISCPQAYNVNDDLSLHEANPTSLEGHQYHLSTSTGEDYATNNQDAPYKPGKWLYLAFATLGVLTIMVALDATALSVALPIIAKELHGSGLEAFWAATSYLLASTVFQPTIAALSNAFGRKWITTMAVVFFLLGIIMSGLSKKFDLLLAGRTIQGIGGGGIIVLTQVMICDLVPLRLRGQWFGVISGMYAIGSVSGPLLGGVFSEKVTWRWIFWINLPFIGMGLVMIPLFIRLGVAQSSFGSKLVKIDWIGSVIFIASTTGLLIPLSWGGVAYEWDSWHTVAPLSAGLGGLVALYFYEERVASNPIIRTSIFKNRNAAAAYLSVVIHGMVVVGSLYYLPLYYEAVKGLSPILSGVALFPETFTVAPGAFIVGTLISRTGHYRWAVWSGWSITTLGLGLLYMLDVDTSTVKWIFLNLVVGLGLGFNYSALGVTLQAATTEEDMTSAVAMFTFFRLLGQALGVVIGGVVFQNQIKSRLSVIPALASLADEYSKDGSGLAALIRILPESPTKPALVQAYADSCKDIWAVFCAIAGFALLSSLVLKRLSLDRQFVSPQQIAMDKEDVGLMTEQAEQGTRELNGQNIRIPDKPDEDSPSSLWYGAKQPTERSVSFGESGKAGHKGDRRRRSPWPRISAVPEELRASSEYSVPVDVPEKACSRASEVIEEAYDDTQTPQLDRPTSTLQLPNIRSQPSLTEMMQGPFEHVMGRIGSREARVRNSTVRNSGVRSSWVGSQRRSRAASSSRADFLGAGVCNDPVMESLFHIQGDASSDLSPLFLIHAVSGFALPFLALCPLSADTPSTSRPVYGLSCPIYQYKSYRLPHSLDEVAREYVARIQSERPHGPYVLGGWSMGGMIAVRMAAILEEQGEEVLHVLLIDSANPQGCPQYVNESERSAVGEWTYNSYSKRTGLSGLEAMAGEEEILDCGSDESDGQDDDDDVDILEYLTRMKEHIYNSWDMINRAGQADDLARGLASPVTLVKCTSLVTPPPGISEERKRAIRYRFEDDCAGWTMEKLKVIPVNAQHDDVFDGDHIDVVTDILRGVLEGINR